MFGEQNKLCKVIITFLTSVISSYICKSLYILILWIILYQIVNIYINKYDKKDIPYYIFLIVISFVGYMFGRFLIGDNHPFTPTYYYTHYY